MKGAVMKERFAAWALLGAAFVAAPVSHADDERIAPPKKLPAGPEPSAPIPVPSVPFPVPSAPTPWAPMPRDLDIPIVEIPTDGPATTVAGLREQMKKLREEREALIKDRNGALRCLEDPFTPEAQDASKLRLRLGGLLTQLQARKDQPPAKTEQIAPKKDTETIPEPKLESKKQMDNPKTEAPPAVYSKTLDPLALAHSLYRAGNFQGALQAYQMMSTEGMKPDERAPLQYMMATCLRKLGKSDDAAALQREVANIRGDDQLAECAQWQLNTMRWRREVVDQLRGIRERLKTLEKAP
ncbi:MAG: hypothetical protein HY040_06490 [Planctomycetes bacterium]|nr:hypothetical protein [Planctomycetota bacterium]